MNYISSFAIDTVGGATSARSAIHRTALCLLFCATSSCQSLHTEPAGPQPMVDNGVVDGGDGQVEANRVARDGAVKRTDVAFDATTPSIDATGGHVVLTDGGGADGSGTGDTNVVAVGDAHLGGVEAVTVVDHCSNTFTWDESTLRVTQNVVYNHTDGVDLRLDIAAPQAAGPHPIIVAVHGGGWYAGDKADHLPTIKYLASLGYVAASVEYRLMQYPDGGTRSFPTAAQDVRCAVRWLRANGGGYGGDPSRLGAIGESAGGHLVSLLGTESETDGLDAHCSTSLAVSPRVDAVVAYYPVEDVRVPLSVWSESADGLDPRQVIISLLGGTPEQMPALAALASPIAHIDANTPPFLLMHGAIDPVVPVSQSRDMFRALRNAGVPVTYIELPTSGHAFPLFAFSQSYYPTSCTAVAFLQEKLKP